MKRSVTTEQFFTAPAVVSACLDLLNKYIDPDSFSLWLEPAAGAGAFLHRLPEERRLGLDIEPLHREISRQNFLEWRPQPTHKRIITIGNPPYGQRAALAFRFIEHASHFSEVIAFILPRSFKKWTFQNRMPERFHLVAQLDCEEFVDPQGKLCTVKSVFQVWVKRDTPRALIELPESHNDFQMRHAHLSRVSTVELASLREYDIAIPQVGQNFLPRAPRELTRGSYWFIRLLSPTARQHFDELDFSFLDGQNTAHKSLSKRDIIYAYTRASGPAASNEEDRLDHVGQLPLFAD